MSMRTLLGCLAISASLLQATELAGAAITGTHDPSQIFAENGTYYIFSTNSKLNLKKSTDLITWTWAAQPFTYTLGIPDYMVAWCNGSNNGGSSGYDASPWNLWAPEIMKSGTTNFLYYSRNCPYYKDTTINAKDTTIVKEQSILGLATSTSISGGSWTDKGAVLSVDLNTKHYRVIDPTTLFDQSGRLWVAVGSFGSGDALGYSNGGIHIFELNTSTGLLKTAGDAGTRLAGSWIEAPYLWYHGGYYYLFFNQRRCCEGLKSTYYIRVGRATSITGPYVDMDNGALLSENGTLFAGLDYAANYSDEVSTPTANHGRVGRELGPGHLGIFTTTEGIDIYTYHYYDSATTTGEPTLGMRSMIWGDDGWPRFGWNLVDGTYAIGSALMTSTGAPTGGMYLAAPAADLTIPKFMTWDGTNLQLWKIARVAANQFSITNVQTGTALTVSSGSVRLATYSASNTAFRWTLKQANDRSYGFVNASTGLSLQIPGSSLTSVELGTAAFTNAVNQRQWVTPAGKFTIKNQWSGMNLAATNTTSASQLVQATIASNALQQWNLVPTLDGYSKLVNGSSGLVMELNGTAVTDNLTIIQKADAGTNAQKWSLELLPDSSWRLINRASGKPIQTSTQTNGAGVVQYRWLSTRNQQWALTYISQANVVISSSSAALSSSANVSSSSVPTMVKDVAQGFAQVSVNGALLRIPSALANERMIVRVYQLNGHLAAEYHTAPGQNALKLAPLKGFSIVEIRIPGMSTQRTTAILE